MDLIDFMTKLHPIFGPGALMFSWFAGILGWLWRAMRQLKIEGDGFKQVLGQSAIAFIVQAGVCLILAGVWR